MEVLRCFLCSCVVLHVTLDANGFEEPGGGLTCPHKWETSLLPYSWRKLIDKLTLEAEVLLVAFNRA